jgi:peptidyl-prolyl cis-trans isomerase C
MRHLMGALVVLFSACQTTQEHAVARVGEQIITVAQYETMAAKLLAGPFRGLEQIDEAVKRKMLDAMVDRELLLLEAARRGLGESPDIRAELQRLEEGLLLKALFAREAVTDVELTDTEVELYFYEQDFDREIRVSSIACPTPEDAAAVLAALGQGGDFAGLAEAQTQQPPGSRGAGDLGFMPPADLLPEVRAQLLSLEPGAYYPEPLETRYGLQVVMVTDRRTVSLAGREQNMSDRLRQEKRSRQIAAYQDSLCRVRGLTCNGAQLDTDDPQRPLCTWEDGQFTVTELARVQELYGGEVGTDSSSRQAELRSLATRELLLTEARALGHDAQVIREPVAQRRSELLSARLYSELTAEVTVTEDQLRAYFQAHAAKYGPQPLVSVREILVADASLASELRQRILAGADMAALAREHSVREVTRSRGGTMQLWRRQNALLGELAPAALDAEIGVLHGPLQVPGGYSLFKVLDQRQMPARTFAQVQSSIRAVLLLQARTAAMDSFLADLRRTYDAEIEVYPAALTHVLEHAADSQQRDARL